MEKLKWGETPFDRLTPEEARLMMCRMYSAITCLRSCMRMARTANPESPYWGRNGSGGLAIAKADEVVEPLDQAYGSESIYRSFFRYADDLLFSGEKADTGFQWSVCPKCKVMMGPGPDRPRLDGQPCRGTQKCDGVMRPLIWDDLKPEKKEKSS